MEALTEKAMNSKTAPKNLGDLITEGIKSNIDSIKAGKQFDLETKAPTTITGDYTGNIALSNLDPQIDRVARQQVLIQNIVNRGTTNSKFVTYIQQTTAPAGAPSIQLMVPYSSVSKRISPMGSANETPCSIGASAGISDGS